MWIRGPEPLRHIWQHSDVNTCGCRLQMDDRDAIRKTFIFKDFTEAWGFMSRTALVAEKVNYLNSARHMNLMLWGGLLGES